MLDGKMDFAVDNDKLCHSSWKFHGLGLQMSVFCGSCIGPVSHAITGVQTGFIHAIHLGCIRENVSTIVQNLFKMMDYGQSEDMHNKLDAQVMIDQGYHTPPVVKFLVQMGMGFLGTHSEKIGQWPFCTGGESKSKWDQKLIPLTGSRSRFVAHRQCMGVHTKATCYQNGAKRIRNLHTTMNGYAKWELVLSKEYPNIVVVFKCDFVQEVYAQWQSSISILCMFQAVSPWFELRIGLFTGTTSKNVLRAVKYLLANDVEFGDAARLLFNIFGFKMQ